MGAAARGPEDCRWVGLQGTQRTAGGWGCKGPRGLRVGGAARDLEDLKCVEQLELARSCWQPYKASLLLLYSGVPGLELFLDLRKTCRATYAIPATVFEFTA